MNEIQEVPKSVPESDKNNKKEGGISRRNFLRKFAIAGAGLLLFGKPGTKETKLTAVSPTEAKIQPEAENTLKGVNTIDLFGDLKSEIAKLFQDNSSDTESYQEITERLGINQAQNWENLKAVSPKTENEILVLLLEALRIHYAEHGEEVVKTRRNFIQGLTPEPVHHRPDETETQLAKAVKIIAVQKDKLGNPVLWFEVNQESVKEMVNSSTASCINMSFELGRMKITYDMYGYFLKDLDAPRPKKTSYEIKNNQTNQWEDHTQYYHPQTEKKISAEEAEKMKQKAEEREIRLKEPGKRQVLGEDGYAGKCTLENVRYLAEIAIENPQKIIVAAAGNPTTTLAEDDQYILIPKVVTPDTRRAREILGASGLWPENLIIVGVEGHIPFGEDTRPYALGADIYVKAEDIKEYGEAKAGSSFAVPIITEIVNLIQKEGLSDSAQIKAELTNLSDYEESSGEKWLVLNMEKVKQRFVLQS